MQRQRVDSQGHKLFVLLALLSAMAAWALCAERARAQDPISDLPSAEQDDSYNTRATDDDYRDSNYRRDSDRLRASLGVNVQQSDDAVEVAQVHDDSPAKRAGLQEGDEIVAIGGRQVSSHQDVLNALKNHEPGQTVTVTLRRDGRQRDLRVKLGRADEDDSPGYTDDLDDFGETIRERASAIGPRARRIGETLGELASEISDTVRDVRRNARSRVRDDYDRYEQEPQGIDDDIRVRVDDDDYADTRSPRVDIDVRDRRAFDDDADDDRAARRRFDRDGVRRATAIGRDRSATRDRLARRDRDDEAWDDTRASRDDRTDRSPRETFRLSRDPESRATARRARAALGVKLGQADDGGVEVHGVYADSPAENAGLRSGDLIERVDGQRVSSHGSFTRYINQQDPGARVELQIERNGRRRTFEVTLGEHEAVLQSGDSEADERARREVWRDTLDRNQRTRERIRNLRQSSREEARDDDERDDDERDSAERDSDEGSETVRRWAQDDAEARDGSADLSRADARERARDLRQRVRETRQNAREELREINEDEDRDDDSY